MKILILFILLFASFKMVYSDEITLKNGEIIEYTSVFNYDASGATLMIKDGLILIRWEKMKEEDARRLSDGTYEKLIEDKKELLELKRKEEINRLEAEKERLEAKKKLEEDRRSIKPQIVKETPSMRHEAEKRGQPEIRRGAFLTSFADFAPEAHSKVTFKRLLQSKSYQADSLDVKSLLSNEAHPGYAFDVKTQAWEVYVPPDYDPKIPYGLLVWISSDESGRPREEWKPIFQKKRLIFVGANKSGNDHDPVLRRIPLALNAVFNLKKLYTLDPERIYISGFSGGGRAASWAAIGFGDIFSGGFYMCGCNAIGGEMVEIPSASILSKVKRRNRYVFFTGNVDFNLQDSKNSFASYKSRHVQNITYLEVQGMGHEVADAEYLEKGIAALDSPTGKFK
jgi:hypothetical protein